MTQVEMRRCVGCGAEALPEVPVTEFPHYARCPIAKVEAAFGARVTQITLTDNYAWSATGDGLGGVALSLPRSQYYGYDDPRTYEHLPKGFRAVRRMNDAHIDTAGVDAALDSVAPLACESCNWVTRREDTFPGVLGVMCPRCDNGSLLLTPEQRLKRELARVIAEGDKWKAEADTLYTTAERIAAERDRLASALRQIDDLITKAPRWPALVTANVRHIAREALNGGEDG